MNVATFIRRLDGFTGDARLYRCEPPMAYRANWDDETDSHAEFVIVSGTVAMFSGPETYIFPANEKGEVVGWGELDGSFRGGIDHSRALADAGYSAATSEI